MKCWRSGGKEKGIFDEVVLLGMVSFRDGEREG